MLIKDKYDRKYAPNVAHPLVGGKPPDGLEWPNGAPVRITAYILRDRRVARVDEMPEPCIPADAEFWLVQYSAALYEGIQVPRESAHA